MKVMTKNMVFATAIALILLFSSATSVFAASFGQASTILNGGQNLESQWKGELTVLQRYKFLDNQIAKWMNDWLQTPRSLHEKTRKNRLTNEAHLTLQQAEILAIKHPGFDANGKVVDKAQAAKSVRSLAVYLQKLHTVFNHKFHHRVPRHKH